MKVILIHKSNKTGRRGLGHTWIMLERMYDANKPAEVKIGLFIPCSCIYLFITCFTWIVAEIESQTANGEIKGCCQDLGHYNSSKKMEFLFCFSFSPSNLGPLYDGEQH